MPVKQLFRLFFCFLFLTPLVLGNSAPLPTEKPASIGSCTLPGPSNFHVVTVGSSTATVAWDAEPGAWGYRAYLSANGNPPSATGTTTATTMTFTGLSAGVTYTVELHSLCSLVDESPQYSSTQFTTIIIEIVCDVNGGASQYTQIQGTSGSLFQYPWLPAGMESYYFFVNQGNVTAKFKFYRSTNGTSNFTIRPLSGNSSGVYLGRNMSDDLQVYCNQEGGAGLTNNFYVRYNNTVITSGYFKNDDLLQFQPATGYYVTVWKSSPWGGPLAPYQPGGETFGDEPVSALPVPSPNPFQDLLYLNHAAPEQPVELALFDIWGRTVKQLHLDPEAFADGALAVPTGELPPGVYFLKLQSGASCTTHKLLKM